MIKHLEMSRVDWENEANLAVTICNREGLIVYMNERSKRTFCKPGEETLVGKNLFDCHSDSSITTIRKLMEKKESNTYTMEIRGTKKLIHQIPWLQNGECVGMVELSIELPNNMPHHVR